MASLISSLSFGERDTPSNVDMIFWARLETWRPWNSKLGIRNVKKGKLGEKKGKKECLSALPGNYVRVERAIKATMEWIRSYGFYF